MKLWIFQLPAIFYRFFLCLVLENVKIKCGLVTDSHLIFFSKIEGKKNLIKEFFEEDRQMFSGLLNVIVSASYGFRWDML